MIVPSQSEQAQAESAQAEVITSIATAAEGSVRTSTYDFETERYDELGQYSALINGYEVGIIGFTEHDERTVLMSVGIVSSYRRQGLATEFIARVLDDLHDRGKTVTIESPVVAAFMSRFPAYGAMIDSDRPGNEIRSFQSGAARE